MAKSGNMYKICTKKVLCMKTGRDLDLRASCSSFVALHSPLGLFFDFDSMLQGESRVQCVVLCTTGGIILCAAGTARIRN